MSVYVEKNQGGWCRGRRELAGIPREKWKDEGDVELGDRRGSGSFVGRTERSCSPGWAPSHHVAESQCKQQALILAGREAGGARHTQSLPHLEAPRTYCISNPWTEALPRWRTRRC